MPEPIALCIEDIDGERFVRCVAIAGRQPGLRLSSDGEVGWLSEAAACELWVSADDRLILYRRPGAPPVTVSRAGRGIEAPEEKPVVLLDQDEIGIGGRRLRVHVHGLAPAVTEPAPLPSAPPMRKVAAGMAAAMLLGAGAGCVEVRTRPPEVMPVKLPDAAVPPDLTPTPQPPVEVRMNPPAPMPAPPPPSETPPKK